MEAKYDFERKYREQILQCSRCGFCRAVCPVFGATLRPALNARGKMLLLKEVMDGKIQLDDELIESLFQCTTCASCFENCPSGVNVPDIIKQVRKDMVNIGTCHPAFTGMNEVLKRHTNIYAEDEPEDFGRDKNRRSEIVYFVGCVGLYREDESTEAALDLLDRLNVDYTLIDEVCCSNNKPKYAELREKGINVMHISQFLKDFDLGVKTDKRVTYHDPCDLGRHCGIYEEPRQIIRKIAPNFIEMPHHHADSLCCGAGGGVRGAYAKNSIAMARRRLQEAEEIGAEVVLTECNSCVHNLSNAKLRRQKFEVYNITRFINELMENKSS
ncbi:MAG: (Fe-S)-binding protein [Deltaproteobacteria bacterium]|nr:(Fe-S)-binding protein [Deltaproteobacteria bacterium]